MSLKPAEEQFIIHWGEMSSRWGINRSVAQIHALLYLSERPLHAEQIAQTLALARSNVSGSLRELQAWGIVRIVHLLGDRRDHFEAKHDAWDLLTTILEQRKRREIDPTIAMLRQCVGTEAGRERGDEYTRQRMRELLELLEALTSWYEQMVRLPRTAQKTVLKLGSKLRVIEGALGVAPAPTEKDPPSHEEEA
jgi:DNA-binding transcriptional regulator GbsR (MarR family)